MVNLPAQLQLQPSWVAGRSRMTTCLLVWCRQAEAKSVGRGRSSWAAWELSRAGTGLAWPRPSRSRKAGYARRPRDGVALIGEEADSAACIMLLKQSRTVAPLLSHFNGETKGEEKNKMHRFG